MEMNELLLTLDRVAANLGKLEAVWVRAEPLIPDSPGHGTSPEYENLRRAWRSLMAGLPPIHEFRIVDELPDADEAQVYMRDVWSAGLDDGGFLRTLAQPGLDIAEYPFRLDQARRRAVRERAEFLSGVIDGRLAEIAADLSTDLKKVVANEATWEVRDAVSELERLLGDSVERKARWQYLHRHMGFSQAQDWREIIAGDWPSVRAEVEESLLTEVDPLPVPDLDLGVAASASPTGGVSVALNGAALNDDQFERPLYDLLRDLSGYENVEWVMSTSCTRPRTRSVSESHSARQRFGNAC